MRPVISGAALLALVIAGVRLSGRLVLACADWTEAGQ